jgi:protein TonB
MNLASLRSGPPVRVSRERSAQYALAIVAAMALHAALLLYRPDGFGASNFRPSPRPMIARLVPLQGASEARSDRQDPPVRVPEKLESEKKTVQPPEALPRLPPVAGPRPRVDGVSAPVEPAPAPAVGALRPSLPAPPPALPDAPEYHLGARLDPGPSPLDNIEPDYPAAAHLQEGTVVLRLLINEAGSVDDVSVVRATPKDVFDESAVAAFGKAKFSPGRILGVAVKSQMLVEVRFVPTNRGARVSGRTY